MRETAVQWYHNQIGFLFQQWHNHQITISEFHFKRLELEQEAKEINKKQMIDFALEFANSDSVYIEYDCEDCPAELTIERPDRLFELTYGGNK
jgi:hypothetical protein